MLRPWLVGIALTLACQAQQGQSFLNRRIPLDQARRWSRIEMRPREPVLLAEKTGAGDRCAHMLTYVPQSDRDPGMATPPPGKDLRMPQMPAMPTCEADVRALGDRPKAIAPTPKASGAPEDGGSARD